ncbi:hypothetical protein E8E12_004916 [Didymella heteroderae]|uniref:Methyltransferase type 11 domain-containing protein n=1 Tax=Didymella heteroderae TaxID=1769908 RepID=A0A9P4WX72_9PLEO|nr:hypothetical protein E8E12_004916 [Didymella heteroderae]
MFSPTILGADLSPVPQVRQKLASIQYVQGNIMNISDARFEQDSFDLIFSRLLVLGMSNWKVYIERCVSLTRPGGWVEMHDFSNAVHHIPTHFSSLERLRPHSISISEIANSSHPTDSYQNPSPWLWETTFGKLLALKDVDLYCGTKIPSLFAEAGLIDIRIKRYMIPYSRWGELTDAERAFADYLQTFARDVMPVAIRKAGENVGLAHAQEVEEAVKDVRRYYESFEGGRNFLWLTTRGGNVLGMERYGESFMMYQSYLSWSEAKDDELFIGLGKVLTNGIQEFANEKAYGKEEVAFMEAVAESYDPEAFTRG